MGKKQEGDIEQLREYYYDVLEGGKLDKTWHKVKKQFPGQYTRAQLKQFLDKQASVQQTKQFPAEVFCVGPHARLSAAGQSFTGPQTASHPALVGVPWAHPTVVHLLSTQR